MGKDIDRNITRQLYEKFKNIFTRNDIIPVKNGGTGEKSLELFYPKLVEDSNITIIQVNNLTPAIEGFTFNGNTKLSIEINKKSMYFEGLVNVTRNANINTNIYLKVKIPNTGYNIKNIKIAPNGSRFSIVGNILSLEGNFDSSNNNYQYRFQTFVPII